MKVIGALLFFAAVGLVVLVLGAALVHVALQVAELVWDVT